MSPKAHQQLTLRSPKARLCQATASRRLIPRRLPNSSL